MVRRRRLAILGLDSMEAVALMTGEGKIAPADELGGEVGYGLLVEAGYGHATTKGNSYLRCTGRGLRKSVSGGIRSW